MTLLNDINVGGTGFKVMNFTPSGTCNTPAGTEVKVCSFADSFELVAGNSINVTFTYANTYGDGSTTYPKLQINGTNYPIKNITGGYASSGAWVNGQTVTFLFYGNGFTQISPTVVNEVTANNMYSVSSNAVANAIFKNIAYENVNGITFSCNQATLTNIEIDLKYIPLTNNSGNIGILYGTVRGDIPSDSQNAMSFSVVIPLPYLATEAVSIQVQNEANPNCSMNYCYGLSDFWANGLREGYVIFKIIAVAYKIP